MNISKQEKTLGLLFYTNVCKLQANFRARWKMGGDKGPSNLNHESSAEATSLKSSPSAGKSEPSGPKIPSLLRVNPLCNEIDSYFIKCTNNITLSACMNAIMGSKKDIQPKDEVIVECKNSCDMQMQIKFVMPSFRKHPLKSFKPFHFRSSNTLQ